MAAISKHLESQWSIGSNLVHHWRTVQASTVYITDNYDQRKGDGIYGQVEPRMGD